MQPQSSVMLSILGQSRLVHRIYLITDFLEQIKKAMGLTVSRL
jgi:hypothetical protein